MDRPGTNIAVVIVAAGQGTRMGSPTPKQYLRIAGQPILRHTLQRFLALPEVTWVLTVIRDGDQDLFAAVNAGLDDPRLLGAVTGGTSRAGSVRCGLEALSDRAPDIVLIHDAARPFCEAALVRGVVQACQDTDGAFAALPVVDALWRVDGGQAQAPVSRDGLWRAQTPQGFRFAAILDAHRACTDEAAADDVAIAREAGLEIAVVTGSEANFKITTPDDLSRAERIAAMGQIDPASTI
jgi:2-C-methyl-D-erythritol 4-phosphate cytidylyltransferase